MRRNFSLKKLRGRFAAGGGARAWQRLTIGALLAANLAAAAFVFKPWAGSAEDLERQAAALRQQVRERQTALDRLRAVATKVEAARRQGDEFEASYFMSRQTQASAIISELDKAARQTGIKQREASFSFDPVEGSDTLTLMTVNAGYEGTFADLMQFINFLDRSPRFLILESLTATPQATGLTLSVTMKLNAFVRESAP